MATKRFLNPKTMAPPPGYTYVVEATGPNRVIFIAGQLGLDLDNKLVGGAGDFRAQCAKAFENLGFALAAVGATFNDVVKINNYLTDMSHIGIFREVRDAFLHTKAPPASTTVAISALARPDAYFTTPHYGGWEAVLVRLDAVDEEELAGRIEDSYAFMASKKKKR